MKIKETSCPHCAHVDAVVNRYGSWRGICRKVVAVHGAHDSRKFMQGESFVLLATGLGMEGGADCSCDQFLTPQEAVIRVEMQRLREENADLHAECDRLILLTATEKAEISALAVDEIKEPGWYWVRVSSDSDWEAVHVSIHGLDDAVVMERTGKIGWQELKKHPQARFIGPMSMPENVQ